MSYPQEHLKNSTLIVNNGAQFISQSDIPTSMQPGERVTVSITMKNTGTTTWTEDGHYRLGSQNPENNNIWGTGGRILLSPGETIVPGQQKTFTFEIIAPSTPGTYNFQWRMLQELVEWFGDFTPNMEISVGGVGRKFDDMILSAKNKKFVNVEGNPTDFRGAISCCRRAVNWEWPLFNEDWVDYVKEQGNVTFLHVRLGPFLAESEPGSTNGGGYLEVNGEANLTKWNDRFWQRVHELIKYAGNQGMWVEIDVIDGWYIKHAQYDRNDPDWRPHPWLADFNAQRDDKITSAGKVEIVEGSVYDLWVRKVVQETGQYGNVVYQDGNEIGGVSGVGEGKYNPKWSISISNIIHNEEERNGYLRHLVGTNADGIGDTKGAPELDYIEFHNGRHGLDYGKPEGINEYNHPDPESFFTPEELHQRYCEERRQGIYFWYWRHTQPRKAMDRTLELIKGGCANSAQSVPLYRYWNSELGDHFYTTDWSELGNGGWGWVYESIQCYVYSNQQPGTVPLYRYWNQELGDHFYTTDWSELGNGGWGWQFESIQCYVYPNQQPGTVPLYRYWNNRLTDHFYTTDWSELGNGAWGWQFESIQCYVYAQQVGTQRSTKETVITAPDLGGSPSIPETFRAGLERGACAEAGPIPETFRAEYRTTPFEGVGSVRTPDSFRTLKAPESFRVSASRGSGQITITVRVETENKE